MAGLIFMPAPLARCGEGVSSGIFTGRASQGHGSWRFAPIRGRFSLAGDHWRMRKVLHLQGDRRGENSVKKMLYRFTGIGFNHSQIFEMSKSESANDRKAAHLTPTAGMPKKWEQV